MKTGRELLDEALQRVVLPPDNQYWACLTWAHKWVLRQPAGAEFTSWHVMQDYPGEPAEPRVWGAVMAQLKRDGLVASTKRYQVHPSPTRHHAPALVWVRLKR